MVKGLSCLSRVMLASWVAPRLWRERPQLTMIALSALRVQNVAVGPFQQTFLNFGIILYSPNIGKEGTDCLCVPLTQTPLRLPMWASCCELNPRPRSEGTGFPTGFSHRFPFFCPQIQS